MAREPNKKIKDERTVVIFIDGACSGNGTSGAEAGIGVYFGPNSPHNVSCSISGAQTSQRAELCAALRALEDAGQLLANNFRVQKVVLVCDSEYVVKGMTDWVFKWQENGWRTSGGAQVANKGDFERLNAVIERMEEDGFNVEFWRVGREYNQDADRLAREACVVRVVHSGFAVVAY